MPTSVSGGNWGGGLAGGGEGVGGGGVCRVAQLEKRLAKTADRHMLATNVLWGWTVYTLCI